MANDNEKLPGLLATFQRLLGGVGLGRPKPAEPPAKPAAPPAARPAARAPGKTRPAASRGGPAASPRSGGEPSRTLPARRVTGGAVRPREPSEEEVEKLFEYPGKLLTAQGGDLEVTAQQRLVVAVLDNGTVLVSKNDRFNPHASSVKALLRRQDIDVTEELLVDLDVIRRLYEAHEKQSGGGGGKSNATDMQRQFTELVGQAASLKASDIHVIVERFEAKVRVRADGVMKTLYQIPANKAQDLCASAFNMADASDASYKLYDYQGARVSDVNCELPDRVQAVRLQFNPLPSGGRYMICRILYQQTVASGQDIDTLGYSRIHIEQIKRMRRKPYGINVISGPTGSGKSTTLQRALTALMEEKRGQVNVITIEDPPEYVIRGAAQLPVTNANTDEERKEKFRQAIAASLRSDPDIIMIGEIRDAASAGLAFAAAMTGHQVWCSLHANDAISILDRFRDVGVEDYKLTDQTLVTGLIGQRLMRRLCDDCKRPFEEAVAAGPLPGLDEEAVEYVRKIAGQERIGQVYVASENGCEKCRGGYAGRTVVAECILPDHEFMQLVRKGDKPAAVRYWLAHLNGMTMLEHALTKMLSGMADPRDVEDRVGILSEFDLERRERLLSLIDY